MDDFSALAARIAVSVGQLRGCIILTRDGLVVGSFPPSDESPVQRAWLRFAALGDPEKGFVEFGDELWVYVRRGPYAAFALAEASVRAGLVIDQLQQLLLTAEEARARRDALKLPDVADAPKSKPRTPLHRGTGQPAHPPSLTRVEAQAANVRPAEARPPEGESGPSDRQPRPLSWILAPEDEPRTTPERRPVSWILAPAEEPTEAAPAKRRTERRTWILPPQDPQPDAAPEAGPASAPTRTPVPPVPDPVAPPDPSPAIAPPPEPVASPAPQTPLPVEPISVEPISVEPVPMELEPVAPDPIEALPQEIEALPQEEEGPDPEPVGEPELQAVVDEGSSQEPESVDRFLLAQEFSRLLEENGERS